MRCNIKVKELPAKCPKCGIKLKTEKCKCGHTVTQKNTNLEEAWFRRMSYGETLFFR
jgi:predicted amidophosphoribosyltransferase